MQGRDASPLIDAKGICVNFNGQRILDQVDLRVDPGAVVTVIGLNGAGKSTLVKVVLGLMQPDCGDIRRRKDLRIGYTPQHLDRDATIPLTVRRFMTLAAAADKDTLRRGLAEVGLPDQPELLDAQLSELSGGEVQRIMLARALLRKPNLLVLDEPAASVDVTGQSDLYSLIGSLRERYGVGVLLVSHDLHLVMASTDHVLCLNHHVCCTGHPETVANHPEFINLFGEQVADQLGVYVHHHDHLHDVDGRVLDMDEHKHG